MQAVIGTLGVAAVADMRLKFVVAGINLVATDSGKRITVDFR